MKYDYSEFPKMRGLGLRKHYEAPEPLKSLKIESFQGAQMFFPKAPEITKAMQDRAEKHFGYTYQDEFYFDAVCNWMKSRRKWNIKQEAIVPFFGILQALATSLRAFTNEGDGVIFLPPSYTMHEVVTKMCGRKIAHVPLILNNMEYSIDFDKLEKAMSLKENKMLVICNPNNPTATLWSQKALIRMAELAKKYDTLILSDEVFAEFAFNGGFCVPFSKQHCNADKAIVCTSISKTFNLVGIAHSNLIIENDEIREAFCRQSSIEFQRDMDPFMYAANIAAYTQCDEWLDQTLEHIASNDMILRSFFQKHLKQVKVFPLSGTFLVWIDWRGLNITEEELSTFLLNEAHIAVDMGSDYAEEGRCFTRFNLALPTKELENGLSRLLLAAKKRGWAEE